MAFASKGTDKSPPSTTTPQPINIKNWPQSFPAKEHCSKCGLCETSYVSKVMDSCAFLGEGMARIDALEERVHGRRRMISRVEEIMPFPTFLSKIQPKNSYYSGDDTGMNTLSASREEGRFGVIHDDYPIQLVKGKDELGAQWTGCVTGIALTMLESKMVDAVVCIASDDHDDNDSTGRALDTGLEWSEPRPILARTVEEVLRGRGVKPALAPSLKVLDEIRNDASIQKLLFCGVGCAVQAFRSIQDDLGLKEVYVMGTNCVDNSPTPKAAQDFLREGLAVDETKVRGYEFMQDFRVHVKMNESTSQQNPYITKPYFCLPGKVAKKAIAKSCLACFDYTNSLADIVVGYMGAPLQRGQKMSQSRQTITIRNERGVRMFQSALDANRIEVYGEATGRGNHEALTSATVVANGIVTEMVGGEVKQEGMPRVMGEIMAEVIGAVGPKGMHFARYSIDYHILRNYLHVLNEWGEDRASFTMPEYARIIVQTYLDNDEKFHDLKCKIVSKNKEEVEV
eukprot:CAMPEP_0184870510 /NCGR_PEP_ID=MMETSP0580-20130426/37721_1 /TAXON_ID=1118495 /ORGANISM="Dactyliosolen fragilissimus" /LENGTH=511 /DNA_ID=CAMNT_0027372605 /DNA_START=289 /DNA_END=1824 /DNA_ORIENTATION=+